MLLFRIFERVHADFMPFAIDSENSASLSTMSSCQNYCLVSNYKMRTYNRRTMALK